VLGRRVVEATTDTDRRVLVVCRTPPDLGVDVEVVDFLDVYLIREKA